MFVAVPHPPLISTNVREICVGVIGVALVERAKSAGTLAPSVTTRNLQRAYSMLRVASVAQIKELIEAANN